MKTTHCELCGAELTPIEIKAAYGNYDYGCCADCYGYNGYEPEDEPEYDETDKYEELSEMLWD